MRRALVIAVSLGLALLLVASVGTTAVTVTARSPGPPARPVVRAPTPAPPTGSEEAVQEAEPPDLEAATAFAAAVQGVDAHCGLGAEPVCDGATCVVLLEMPDMESVQGWGEVLFSAPTFVLSTAARDLGMGPDLLPCAVAIDGLGGGARVVEQPGGRELWCAGQGPGVAALCEAEAEARYGVTGFAAPDVRRLSFRTTSGR